MDGYSGNDCAILPETGPIDNKAVENCGIITASGKTCNESFRDGICDVECNNKDCSSDGLDCRQFPEMCPEK